MCCKKLCVKQFPIEHLSSLRDHFNSLTYDEQNLYLTGLMQKKETKRTIGHKRKSNPLISKNGKKVGRPPAEESSFSTIYQIRNEKGINKVVCQKAFLLINGFGKRRLEIFRKKFSAGSTLPELDCRGKHKNRPYKISEEIHQKVREHIMSFSAQQSHYSRHKNSERLYLSPELSINRMYEQFLEAHNPDYFEYMKAKQQALINHVENTLSEVKPMITKRYYHDVFVNEFNIHFGYPHSDTCDTCDALKIKINENKSLSDELQTHLKAAEEGYASLHRDISLCKESWLIANTAQP
jgi:hypothetical protein